MPPGRTTADSLTVVCGEVGLVEHVVIFTWTAGTTREQISALQEALDCMAEEFADLTSLRHGSDLGYRDGNGDYALAATFRDKADWDAYQAHPKHKAFVKNFVTPLQASRAAIQF
jgi:hypothetical protein